MSYIKPFTSDSKSNSSEHHSFDTLPQFGNLVGRAGEEALQAAIICKIQLKTKAHKNNSFGKTGDIQTFKNVSVCIYITDNNIWLADMSLENHIYKIILDS